MIATIRLRSIITIVGLVCLLLSVLPIPAQPVSADAPIFTRPLSIFGADVRNDIDNAGVEARITWARINIDFVSWQADTNVFAPTYASNDPSKLHPIYLPGYKNSIESQVVRLLDQGFTPIALLQNLPPDWRIVKGVPCSRAKPEVYTALASLMSNIVTRLKSTSSFDPITGQQRGVQYWQLFNEPDFAITDLYPGYSYDPPGTDPNMAPGGEADPYYIKNATGIGCWANTKDNYRGAGEFTDMLQVVTPAIHAADANAKVILGGMALTCGPNTPPSTASPPTYPCQLFFEGILRHKKVVNGQTTYLNDGKSFFDMVDVHAYTYDTQAQVDWETADANWGVYNGVALGVTRSKIQFIRDKLAANGVTNKPIIVGEAALACGRASCGDTSTTGFQNDQGRYAVRLYAHAMNMNNNADTNKVVAVNWYAMRLGKYYGPTGNDYLTELLYSDATIAKTRHAYQTYRLIARLFQDATVAYPLNVGSNVEAYEVRPSGPYRYRIYWTNTAVLQPVSIPDADGCTEGIRYSYAWDNNSTYGNVNGYIGSINVNFDPQIVRCRSLDATQQGNSPAIASWNTTHFDAFAIGFYGDVGQKVYNGSWPAVATWASLSSPRSGIIGSVAAVSWAENRIDLFVRGGDNQLYQKYYQPSEGGWSGWNLMDAPPGGLMSTPTVASWGQNRLDVFARGADNNLWHKYFEPSEGGWSGWQPLGSPTGGLASAPTAVSWDYNRIDIFVRGSDGQLYQKYFEPTEGGWSGWGPLGAPAGGFLADPAVTSWAPHRLDIFVRGANNILQHKYFELTENGWSGWENLGSPPGGLTSSPGVISRDYGKIDVIVKGNSNSLQYKSFVLGGGGWSNWTQQTSYPT